MELNRREFGTAAGISLSAILAGCSALEDDSPDGGDDSASGDDEDENETNSDEANGEDGDESYTGDEDDTDEAELIEDESVSGTVTMSAEAEDHVAVVRDTFTWTGESPSDQCQVHVMLENASGAEVTVDMEARIYDEDGAELASSTETEVEGPEPGEDDAVYSLELDDCEGTDAYELEIANVDADGDDEPSEPEERDDDDDEPDEPDEPDEADEPSEPDEPDGPDDDDSDNDDEGQDDDESEDEEDDSDETDDDDDDEDDSDEEEPTNILRVIVQDGDEDPIDHATVNVDAGGFGGWSETQTVDGQGRAEFEVESGEYAVTVTADDYPTLEETVDVEVNLQYTVTLRQNS